MICNCSNCALKTVFFDSFKDEELEFYCESRVEVKVPAKEFIIKQGAEIKDFIYLKEGLIKLFRTSDNGKSQIISFGKPMDFVSIQSVFSEKKYNYSVQALIDSVVCVLDFNTVKDLIKNNGNFATSLLKQISFSYDRITMNTLDILQKRLYGKVAHVLIYFADQVYENDEYSLPISRKEISEYIGMSVENVIRTISEFRKDKIINIFGKKIEIVDLKSLERISLLG